MSDKEKKPQQPTREPIREPRKPQKGSPTPLKRDIPAHVEPDRDWPKPPKK
jgi:hypothetical protein